MRKHYFLFLAVYVLGAMAAQAGSVDPQGVFDNYVKGTPVTPETDFVFGSDASGGGVFSFQNVSGNTWSGMDFFVSEPAGISITCGGGPFYSTCQTSSTPTPGNPQYEIKFTGPINGGIANLGVFSFNLNDLLPTGGQNLNPNGAGGWGNDADFTVVPTFATPEPAPFLLVALPLAMLAILSKLRRPSRITV